MSLTLLKRTQLPKLPLHNKMNPWDSIIIDLRLRYPLFSYLGMQQVSHFHFVFWEFLFHFHLHTSTAPQTVSTGQDCKTRRVYIQAQRRRLLVCCPNLERGAGLFHTSTVVLKANSQGLTLIGSSSMLKRHGGTCTVLSRLLKSKRFLACLWPIFSSQQTLLSFSL